MTRSQRRFLVTGGAGFIGSAVVRHIIGASADGVIVVVAAKGRLGETYCIGGDSGKTNIEVVRAICDLLDELAPDRAIGRRDALISFVADRPGHDPRYAIDASRMTRELGWRLRETFASGLRKTVEWYLANWPWWQHIRDRVYGGERLGVLT